MDNGASVPVLSWHMANKLTTTPPHPPTLTGEGCLLMCERARAPTPAYASHARARLLKPS